MSWGKQTVVGIFSRSGAEEHLWLVNALNDITGICPKSFVITNSNASAFRDAVYTSTFAILYHSMNRGRLNITDMTDSLYDEELQFLFITLGKDKVVVIADDLVDSSDNAKDNILRSQPTIGLMARDIFLFSRVDKTVDKIMISKMTHIKEIITAASGKRSTKASTCVRVISHVVTLVPLRLACSDPSPKNLCLLFACTMASLWLRRHMRLPVWAFAISWAAASLGLLRNKFFIPHIPAGLRLSETYIVPAGVVTILSIYQPDWPHILLSHCTSMLKKQKGEINQNEPIGFAR
ncbi:uncharacterized protein LOC108705722 isoform X2 [Xenopus laevis]|uniref:Uncharacterized protein LOC108705722 isoform X2 n=1 Tax=Xenopus laevis TaxID=8355 RepID=A0A8J1LYJ0_XENLA|nr:uncharacterized protein LOC108705722 isoform X2 [Xenopus laevis]